jgi:hypothetical protein
VNVIAATALHFVSAYERNWEEAYGTSRLAVLHGSIATFSETLLRRPGERHNVVT